MAEVTFDSVAVKLDGRRQLILSGAVHYPRSTPAMWPEILRNSRDAGLNTIETYVFWNLHEHQRGKYDFTGRLDIAHFLALCQEYGMKVILRVGPYICAETNFGGLPPWLLNVPGLVTRTNNEPFKEEMLQWCKVLMTQVADFQASRGGPIILVQLENEYNNIAKRYGEDGQKYMEWVNSLKEPLGIEVPLIMCEGSAEGAIETLNGFAVAERVPEFRQHKPNQPLLWTENWPGWYDVFGHGHHLRDPQEIAYNVMRFIGVGGTGINYYMWHGGTNFGRDAMYMQTTSYDFNAPLDEYGLPTTKSEHLKKLHAILWAFEDTIIAGAPTMQVIEAAGENEKLPRVWTATFNSAAASLVFAINSTKDAKTVNVSGLDVPLAPLSAAAVRVLQNQATLLYQTTYNAETVRIERTWEPVVPHMRFKQITETVHSPLRPTYAIENPVSMLPYTKDLTDYGWHHTTIESKKARTATLVLPQVRDFSALFVNGRYAGGYPKQLQENTSKNHWQHTYEIKLKEGVNKLTVLVSALGLIKGDWMIDAPQSEEKKGLIGKVLLDDKAVRINWTLEVGLTGEACKLYEPLPGASADWQPLKRGQRYRWFRTTFKLEDRSAAGYAIDMSSMYKGLIWLNGQCIGRYWQIPVADPKNPEAWQAPIIELGTPAGAPTQRYYHLPKEWLKEVNTLVIFEETTANPDKLTILKRV